MFKKIKIHAKVYANKKLRLIFYLPSIFLLNNVCWINSTFGSPTTEQILFHVQHQLNGIQDFDKTFLWSYLTHCLLGTLVYSLLFITIENELSGFKSEAEKCNNLHEHNQGSQNSFTTKNGIRWIIFGIPIYITIAAGTIAFTKFQVHDFFMSATGKDYIKEHYIDPSELQFTKRNPKNLVLIYVESLEKTYSDNNLFKKNLLSSLDAHGGITFNNFPSAPGTGWTTAAMVSSQCAIPLKVLFLMEPNPTGSSLTNSFLPNATCLGDTLKTLGYKNVFLCGHSLNFAGTGTFLKTHGYDSIYSKKEFLAEGKYNSDNLHKWGLYDDDLFAEARIKLDELELSNHPFNLTIFTIDMHGHKGFLSKSCKEKGGESFEDIVKCSIDEVSKFISYMEEKGYLEHTNVVILGDHLAMKNPVYDKLLSSQNRTIYNLWISHDKIIKNRDEIIHFDLPASILEFININIQGDRYGLGYSAFYPSQLQPESDRLKDMKQNLLNKSDFYYNLWVTK